VGAGAGVLVLAVGGAAVGEPAGEVGVEVLGEFLDGVEELGGGWLEFYFDGETGDEMAGTC
jgi:hypothetical protein